MVFLPWEQEPGHRGSQDCIWRPSPGGPSMRDIFWQIHDHLVVQTWGIYSDLDKGQIFELEEKEEILKAWPTLLQPRHPAHSTRAEAMGAKTKVPTPDPVTQSPGEDWCIWKWYFLITFLRPVAKESRREKYWPTATTAGTYLVMNRNDSLIQLSSIQYRKQWSSLTWAPGRCPQEPRRWRWEPGGWERRRNRRSPPLRSLSRPCRWSGCHT